MDINKAKELISKIHLEYNSISSEDIDTKMVDVSLYPWIMEEITDYVLPLTEFILPDEIETVWNYVRPSISGNNDFCPFIDVIGGHMFCIDMSEGDFGNVFYIDFDFGIFSLKEDAQTFLSKLKDTPTSFLALYGFKNKE